MQYAFIWICLWWLLLPFNLGVMIVNAVCPPFTHWYEANYPKLLPGHKQISRKTIGLAFVPCAAASRSRDVTEVTCVTDRLQE